LDTAYEVVKNKLGEELLWDAAIISNARPLL
jgi:hypothetical protein